MNKKLSGEGGIPEGAQPQRPTMPMVFMAGYTKFYRSQLYHFPADYFESQLPEEGRGALPHDKTLGKPYKHCVLKANPHMIYHVKISDSVWSASSSSSSSSSAPIFDDDDFDLGGLF